VVAGETLHRVEARHDLLRRHVRVDLSPFTGRRIRLRWTVGDPTRRLRAGLARLSLRPLEQADPPPPILLVCSDTHRFDYSIADEGPGLMPQLAALRERSVTYRRAWSNASWTLPSIASALTGLYPRYHRTGLKVKTGPREELTPGSVPPGFFAAPWSSVYHLVTSYPARLDSLPELLRRRGYRTALVAANAYYFLSGLAWDGFSIAVEAPNQPAGVVNQEVGRLLESLADEGPLLLVVHYTDVHDYAKSSFPRGFAGPGVYGAGREQVRAPYRDAVRAFDGHLGDLIRRWDQAVGLEGSLVVFYSDHGEHLFDPGHPDLSAALDRAGPELPESYRRLAVPVLNHGNSMQESLLRIPLVVKFPASAGVGGTSVDAPVSLVDLAPTLLEVAGVPSDTRERAPQGRSLLALARGEAAPERALFADFQLYGEPLASIRRGRHKLVLRLGDDSTELRETCLACRSDGDPGEPLDDERIRGELSAELMAHLEEARRATAGLRSGHRVSQEEALEQLRALGYAE
jgi:arylsulfatase A-like enzyme